MAPSSAMACALPPSWLTPERTRARYLLAAEVLVVGIEALSMAAAGRLLRTFLLAASLDGGEFGYSLVAYGTLVRARGLAFLPVLLLSMFSHLLELPWRFRGALAATSWGIAALAGAGTGVALAFLFPPLAVHGLGRVAEHRGCDAGLRQELELVGMVLACLLSGALWMGLARAEIPWCCMVRNVR